MVMDILDVFDRAMTGEKVTEREYDLRVFNRSTEIVKEYGFKCDPNTPVPSDNTLADEVFEAALRLAVDLGGWCLDTRRIMKFTEEEIKDALREAPQEITIGAGKDAKKVISRRPEDSRRVCFCGGTSAPFTEEVAPIMVRAMALLPIDLISPFNLWHIDGRRITGMPLEAWASRRAVEWTREGLRRAGKPSLHIVNYPISAKAVVIISVLDSDHIRKTDSVLTSPLPELFKIDYEMLTANAIARDYGCIVDSNVTSMAGGYAGGYEGSTIVGLAGQLLANVTLSPDVIVDDVAFQIINPDLWATPETRWANNLAIQAISRNTNLRVKASAMYSGEPCTEQTLMEIAYSQIGYVVSGVDVSSTHRPVRPRRVNLPTPMEARWGLKISEGALKMSREEANEFIKKIAVPKEKLVNPPKGKGFEECYNLETLKPKKEYLEIYDRAEKKLEDLGFPFRS